jgi:L-seryl-tRNA(Ser) seleniumtransferase
VTSEKTSALQAIADLKVGDLAVYTREYQANNGIIEFDIRAVDRAEMTAIVNKLQTIMGS